MRDPATFLVPYDFSEHARAALYTALDLGRRLGADVHLVHVVQPPSYVYGYAAMGGAPPSPLLEVAEAREGALQSLRAVAASVEGDAALEAHVVEGDGIAEGLCDVAKKLGADLIVMGTHGRTGLAHAFLGSVAERTLRRAPCPVLSVRAPEEGEGA